MEQTILQRPMQPTEIPTLQETIGVIYQQPVPRVLPVQPVVDLEFRTDGANIQEQVNTVPITIGKPRLAILEALLIFRKLTAEMLNDYLFSPGMMSDTQKHLRTLEKAGYIQRNLPMKQTRFGSAPYAYALDTEGYKYLRALGKSVPARFRDEQHEGYPVTHTLTVNQVLMKALYLDEHDPSLTLRDFEHEKDLNAKPLRVQLPDEAHPTSLSPDLWLYFYTQDRIHSCPVIEVNLSRMWQKDWREKVRLYLHCLDAYEARYGIDVLTVAVIVTTSRKFTQREDSAVTEQELAYRKQDERDREKRLTNFLLWTEAELNALGAQDDADLFRFTNVTLDTLSPHELFYGAHWRIPFQTTPVPLLRSPRKEDET